MTEPSEYELAAWRAVQDFQGRQFSRRMAEAGSKVSEASAAVGERTSKFIESRPRAQAAVERTQKAAAKGGELAGSGIRAAGDALPPWVGTVGASAQRTTARVSRAGLSPKRVVKRYVKQGHAIARLQDVRHLDLELVDDVRGRSAAWMYPAGAAISGAGAGLVITGGQLSTAASAGAAAAPSSAAVAGAFVGDAASVLALGSRAVGRTALMYGYDPEDPAEKLFIMSVVNVGSAATTGAKTAAMKDVSKLTQALVRGKTWEVLNTTVLSRVANQFAKGFSVRLTKQGLGKLLPAAGVAIAGTLNWATLEGIVDAADVAYRRRFLLEKYPQLAEGDTFGTHVGSDEDEVVDSDIEISLVDHLRDAGGPDLDLEDPR